jgi:hypothetical protein
MSKWLNFWWLKFQWLNFQWLTFRWLNFQWPSFHEHLASTSILVICSIHLQICADGCLKYDQMTRRCFQFILDCWQNSSTDISPKKYWMKISMDLEGLVMFSSRVQPLTLHREEFFSNVVYLNDRCLPALHVFHLFLSSKACKMLSEVELWLAHKSDVISFFIIVNFILQGRRAWM